MTGRLASLARIRAGHPELPIGLLVYANLVWRRGVERFYADAAEAGVDSVLVADVPFAESGPFTAAAAATGIAPVLIVPPGASSLLVARIAGRCRGYTYVTTRAGVTGDAGHHDEELAARLTLVGSLGAPPPLLGFGIGSPAQVHQAVAAGAAGVIVGSALVSRAATDPEEAMALFATLPQAARHPPIATFG
jgi:tryptophan synthase alpha chain